jgi:hypothetical protein
MDTCIQNNDQVVPTTRSHPVLSNSPEKNPISTDLVHLSDNENNTPVIAEDTSILVEVPFLMKSLRMLLTIMRFTFMHDRKSDVYWIL